MVNEIANYSYSQSGYVAFNTTHPLASADL